MKTFFKISLIALLFGFSSCVVNSPRYSTVEKVLALQINQTEEEVSQVLGIPPYNFIFKGDGETILLYKFRVTDRSTVPLFTGPTNGHSKRGKYVNLKVTYNKAGRATKMQSCSNCDETIDEDKKFDINKVITLITVTLPIVLVFLGIKFAIK